MVINLSRAPKARCTMLRNSNRSQSVSCRRIPLASISSFALKSLLLTGFLSSYFAKIHLSLFRNELGIITTVVKNLQCQLKNAMKHRSFCKACANMLPKPVQQTRNHRHDGGSQSACVDGQILNVAAKNANSSTNINHKSLKKC